MRRPRPILSSWCSWRRRHSSRRKNRFQHGGTEDTEKALNAFVFCERSAYPAVNGGANLFLPPELFLDQLLTPNCQPPPSIIQPEVQQVPVQQEERVPYARQHQ